MTTPRKRSLGRGGGADSVAVRHDLEHVPMVDPAAKGGLIGVLRRRYLLRLMVRRELRARYIGSKMGLAWSYINPFVRFLTFYFVFGIILGRGQVPHFAIHLFAGMVMVNLFTESFNSGTRSIMQNKAVVQKMPLPREIFPIASTLVSLYHTGPQMVILVIVCLGTGSFSPDPMGLLAALMALGIVLLLGAGMGLMFAAINVMYRDWTRVVQIFTQVLPFSVPMMYPYTLVRTRFEDFPIIQSLYLFNPITEAVLLIQRGFWITTVSDEDAVEAAETSSMGFQPGLHVNFPDHLMLRGLIMLGFAALFLVFAQWVFTRLDDKIPDRLI
jgi:ABC-2 type transport system permease protein